MALRFEGCSAPRDRAGEGTNRLTVGYWGQRPRNVTLAGIRWHPPGPASLPVLGWCRSLYSAEEPCSAPCSAPSLPGLAGQQDGRQRTSRRCPYRALPERLWDETAIGPGGAAAPISPPRPHHTPCRTPAGLLGDLGAPCQLGAASSSSWVKEGGMLGGINETDLALLLARSSYLPALPSLPRSAGEGLTPLTLSLPHLLLSQGLQTASVGFTLARFPEETTEATGKSWPSYKPRVG